MTSIRAEVAAAADTARREVAGLGMRVRSVQVVTVTKTAAPGALRPVVTESALTPDPPPRVRQAPAWVGAEAGRVEAGDLTVDRISIAYTREQLDPGGDSHWLVDGQPYRLVSLEERLTQWVARIRRMERMP